ncbi:MAG: dihydrofolate reductase [Bdellovibrionales bacterium]|nr:dihydrofolate reductase [Bdellovibrionales bacterium]
MIQIAAASRNRVIGIDGKLPWHIPEDLKFFKEKTLNRVCIMGRKTFDSIGKRPLPKRLNIVVSRTPGVDAENLRFSANLQQALEIAAREIKSKSNQANPWVNEIMIVGGGEIYRQALGCSDRIYLTEVEIDLSGDAFFPEIPAEFKVVHRDHRQGDLDYTFVTYEKI